MKNKKFPDQRQNKEAKKTDPIRNNKDVEKNSDNHIDQDFSGFPHAPASNELINPKTKQEKKSAALDVKDGEKINKRDELESDGPANPSDATEDVRDNE